MPNLGTFAPGAGPVVAPDGTVYLGTMEGKIIALHADGSPFWSRDIHPEERIIASPAVGADSPFPARSSPEQYSFASP